MLEEVRDDVVVIGAAAITVALDGTGVALTPTRDVDAGVATQDVEHVVAHLEAAGLTKSAVAHERDFTWVRGDLKVQLLRPFHPFAKGIARNLPVSNVIPELAAYREGVAFSDEPERERFVVAGPAALVGLKFEAFGRTRPDGEIVERDFSDVSLLLECRVDDIASALEGPSAMRERVLKATRRLEEDDEAVRMAARERVRIGREPTQREAEAAVRRIAVRARDRIG